MLQRRIICSRGGPYVAEWDPRASLINNNISGPLIP